jgi:hypothetical protein
VTVAEAEQIVAKAKAVKRKVVIGYILRHHPAWTQFIQTVQTLGKPLVMRMNLNQQSYGDMWNTHKSLLPDVQSRGRLRRALRGRHVPHDRQPPRARLRHRRAPHRGHAGRPDQLRPPAGDVRRRLRRLV